MSKQPISNVRAIQNNRKDKIRLILTEGEYQYSNGSLSSGSWAASQKEREYS
ncbi:small muscle protein, X-linked, isoform CRA_b [Mus musculus]|uniref:Small muscle protein, X-linked n=1 Tax=Mus musculus TaxID=10090 RepID=D6RJ22_MOUSE|nr:small muscle protein, X-linked, isoform CRA_b [Mus musculus]